MESATAFPVRAERRQQTEERILGAARDLFSKAGYDRTTIRAVAAKADVDPALVMHYFGSKEALFSAAVHVELEETVVGAEDELAERLLAKLGDKLEREPEAQLALLRSMLTHPQATEEVRSTLSRECGDVVGKAIGGKEGALRAGLVSAMVVGVIAGRHLLQLEGLRDADPEKIQEILRPCFHSLVDRPTGPKKTARAARGERSPTRRRAR